jgi:AcrR family transcriptional regulator
MLSQEIVDDGKRERCAVAIAELAHERGGNGLSTTRVIARVQISRNTFYDLFAGIDEALEFACELADERLAAAVEDTAQEQGTWEEWVDRTIGAFLDAVREQPLLAELCFVHRASIVRVPTDPEAEASAAALLTALKRGRPGGERAPGSFAAIEELVVAGILAVVAKRLRDGDARSLPALRGELVTLALTPYATARTGAAKVPRHLRPVKAAGQ